jgi:hypothetical protein
MVLSTLCLGVLWILGYEYRSLKHFFQEGKEAHIAVLILSIIVISIIDTLTGILIHPLFHVHIIFYHLPACVLAITASYLYFFREYIRVKQKRPSVLFTLRTEPYVFFLVFCTLFLTEAIMLYDLFHNPVILFPAVFLGIITFIVTMVIGSEHGYTE